jgi:membrane protein involved in colicin uptake
MVPEPKPNPNNPIPEMPGWAVMAPGMQLPALVLGTAHAAWDLLGSGDKPQAAPGFRGGGGSFGPPPAGHEGSAADAEQEAAKKLTARTETLKGLDAQLKAIGDQIIDSNSEKKKRIEAIAGEVEKELQYLDSSKDSSVAKVQAVNEFLSEKSGEIAKIITDAADEAAQNRALIAQLQNEYGPDYGGGGYDDGSGGGGGYQDGGGGGGGYQDGGGGGYQDGTYDQGQYGEQGGLADTLGQALPGLASAGQGLVSGLTSPVSGLSDLGGIIGSAVKGSGEDRGRDRDDEDRRERDKADDERKADEDRKAKEEADQKAEEERKAKEEADRKAKEQQPGQPGQPGGAQPTGPAPTPPPAPTLVIRPDGSPVTAANPAVAAAAKAVLGGANVEDGYKAAGMTLPALGAPLKDTISPANAGVGDLAVFKDKFEMLLGDKKVYLDGQMQDMAALGKLTGFMGFIKAPASSTPNVPAAAPASSQAAGITPAQLSADPTGAI